MTERWILLKPTSSSLYGLNFEPTDYSQVPNVEGGITDRVLSINLDRSVLEIPKKLGLQNLTLEEQIRGLKRSLEDSTRSSDTNEK